ncbi:MAG TPA: histidine phosphatase family protein [Phycisphaerae bacterium]|nr:histidine phosphatase family protein [Phycisphaerae bacterium]
MLAYVIRHAESVANTRADPGLNTALSPLGNRQAKALARRFARPEITAIYSSPFLRAIQTALPIARQLHLPIRIRPELCEFQGLLPGTHLDLGLDDIATITQRHPEAISCPDLSGPFAGPFSWPPPDETLSDMIARVRSFANSLKARWLSPDDVIIAVGHGSPSARLIEAWLTDQPGPSFRFAIDNAAVAALRYLNGVSSLVCLNEISHLRDLPPSERSNYRPDGSIKPASQTGCW